MEHKIIFPQELAKAVSEAVGSVYDTPQPAPDDAGLYGLEGVFSTIYLKGDVLGKISIFIRGAHAVKIVTNMLGTDELAEDASDTLDGIGEVLNIITGCFKKHLEPHHCKVEISVPSTRVTSVVPPGRWEHTVDLSFTARDVSFKVSMSYRMPTKEEKSVAPVLTGQAKLKFSAAELLKQALAKKK